MPPRSGQFHEQQQQQQGMAVAGDRPLLPHKKKSSFLSSKLDNVRGHGGPTTVESSCKRSVPSKDTRRTRNGIAKTKDYDGSKMKYSNNLYDYSVPEEREQVEQQQVERSDINDHGVVNTSTTTTSMTPYNNMTMLYGGGQQQYGSSAANGMMMMMPPIPSGGMGPFSGIYQVLYGVQNVIFSITQAVQLVGMNQQLLQQAWESISQMVDHAFVTFHEMRMLELQNNREETEKEKQQKRRLKALRYTLVFGGSWLVYKIVRSLVFHKRNRRRQFLASTYNAVVGSSLGSLGMSAISSPYSYPNYYSSGMTYGGPQPHMNNGVLYGGSGYAGSGYV
jgi:hypothetical protein